MLQGLTTVSFFADDLTAAQAWYENLLGIAPYFARPGYVEFRIGEHQHELGIIDARYARGNRHPASGAVVYWHVDNPTATFERLLEMGATTHEKPVERGPGFTTASVIDPFGNILGVMYNQHYQDMSGRPRAAGDLG